MNKFIKTILKALNDHKTDIKFGVGVAGLLSTSVLVGIKTVKAVKDVENYKETHENVTTKDVIKVVLPNYILPTVLAGVSTGLTLSARKDMVTLNAGLAAACTFYETSVKDIEEAIQSVSDDAKKEITEKISEKQIEKAPEQTPTVVKEIIIEGDGDVLCFDPISSRYFRSRRETIREKINNLNFRMSSGYEFSVSVNEYYDEIGLPPTDFGDEIGWNATDGLIDVYFSTKTSETGVPCLVVGFYNLPKYGFDRCG